MHLVRTFKTVDLFKVPLCEGIFLRMDGMIEGLEKKKSGCQNLKSLIGTYNKGRQSSENRSDRKTSWIYFMLLLVSLAKRLKTLPIVIVKTHHSARKLNRISSLLYGWYKSGVQTMTEAWVANTVLFCGCE